MMEQINNSDYDERLEAAGGAGNRMEEYRPEDYEPLNLIGLPEFQLKNITIPQTLYSIFLDFAILLVVTILVFYFCTVSFNQYDVRIN